MDRDVLACVIGDEATASVTMESAVISGYQRVRLPHETYPILVPDAEGAVEGVLLYGLNKESLNRIVFFEGEEYALSPCSVKVFEGNRSRCVQALFFDEGIMPPADSVVWNFADWQRVNKDYMIRQSRVYMSYYGKMSAVEADVFWQEYRE